MKSILAAALMVVGTLAGAVLGQDQTKSSSSAVVTVASPGASGPKIQFAETVFEFGKIESGEVVRHDFVFTNTGTTTLEIKDVRPGCGCTTAGAWDKQVEPGNIGVIPLQFNSASFSGTVTKPATVTCNDPGRPAVGLMIKGTVWRPIDFTPAMAVFNVSTEIQTNLTRVVRIVSNVEEPIELSDLQCSNRAFQAELKTVRAGKEFELHITAAPPFFSVSAPVTLKTSLPKMPTINITAYLMLEEPVTVAPTQFMLPVGPLTNAVHFVIAVRGTGTNALSLSEPRLNVPGVEVRLQEIQAGRFFNLTGDFPAGFQTQPGQSVEITVKSNHPQFPIIHVPVIQRRPPAPVAVQNTPSSPSRIVTPKPVLPVAAGK